MEGWERDHVAALADFVEVGGWIAVLEGVTGCGVSSEDLVSAMDFGVVPFPGLLRGNLMGWGVVVGVRVNAMDYEVAAFVGVGG